MQTPSPFPALAAAAVTSNLRVEWAVEYWRQHSERPPQWSEMSQLCSWYPGGDSHLELSIQVAAFGACVPDWISRRLGLTAEGLRSAGVAAYLPADPGIAIEALLALREATGVSYVTAAQIADAFTPVIAGLGGR